MIFGELLCPALAHPVDTTVSHLGQHHVIAHAHHCADGGPHARLSKVQLRHGIDDVGRCLNRPFQQSARGASGRFRVGVGIQELALALLDHTENRVARLAARHLACSVSTHSIRHDPEAQIIVAEISVFVVLALAANIGATERMQSDARLGTGAHRSSKVRKK